MSDQPPADPPAGRTRLSVAQLPEEVTGRPSRVEDATLRLLRDMRAEHAASLEAMRTELATTRRLYAGMEGIFDRLDQIKAELLAFRAETGKSLRKLEGDMIAAEGQNIARQAEIIEAVNRIADLELSIPLI